MIKNINYLFVTCFGIGTFRFAPGTITSLITTILLYSLFHIVNLSIRLKNEMGGWIFHKMIDFSNPTPSIDLGVSQPRLMKKWTNREEVQDK